MKCIWVAVTVFIVVWLFSVIVPAVGCKFRQLWGRFILVPLGYDEEAVEDFPAEESHSREERKSHGAHRSHDGDGSHHHHHHHHHHHSLPSSSSSDADEGVSRQNDANVQPKAREEDVSAMKESKNRALCRGKVVEAYYWLLQAELAGATDVESELRVLRAKWISRNCPREYENERSDFTRDQGSFARAVLHLRSGKAYARSCRKIRTLASKGLPEAKRFVERYTIKDFGDDSHDESSHRHHGHHKSV